MNDINTKVLYDTGRYTDRFIGYGVPGDYYHEADHGRPIQIAVIIKGNDGQTMDSKTIVTDMMIEFKERFRAFCKKEKSVHSIWVCENHHKKDVTLYTILDDFDFDLESKIFNGPYSELPPEVEGYFIDLRIENLCGESVSQLIPDGFEMIYIREKSDAFAQEA